MTIPAAPPVPDRTVPEEEFDPAFEAFNRWQADDLVPGLNAVLPTIEAAATASAAAIASANYKGLWSSLTGALAIPASVAYADKVWMLTESVADVAAHVPGVSSKWLQLGGNLTPVAQETATLTADRTLTSSSAGVQVVTPSGVGYSVILPDATTLSAGKQYIVRNAGSSPIGLRANGGALLGACDGGTGSVVLTLTDNSTSAGVWAITGDGYAPGLVTVHSELSSTYPIANLSRVSNITVDLDSNKSISFLPLSTGFSAVCIDNATRTIGTPAAVETLTMSAGAINAAYKVSSNSVVVFWTQAGTNCKAAVLTITGTSIAVGFVATAGANWFVANSPTQDAGVDNPYFVQLSATSYLVCGASGTVLRSIAISVSGTTVTIGTALDTSVTSVANAGITLHALTSTTAIVIYKEGSAAPYTNTARVISVSGTTCTAGTAVSGVTSNFSPAAGRALLSPTLALIVDNNNTTTEVRATAISISGTTCTAGTTTLIESGLTNVGLGYGYSRQNTSLAPLSGTTALMTYDHSLGGITQSRAVVISVSGTTITAGSALAASINDATTLGGVGFRGIVSPSGFIAFRTGYLPGGSSSGGVVTASAHSISGTAITQKLSTVLPQLGLTQPVGLCALSNGDHALHAAQDLAGNSGAIVMVRSDGSGVKVRGLIQSPPTYTLAPSAVSGGFAFRAVGNGFVLIGSTQNSQSVNSRSISISRVEVAA